ncbi:MAG: hypothetical protein ACLT1W_13960 [Alistipes onderdonkii]
MNIIAAAFSALGPTTRYNPKKPPTTTTTMPARSAANGRFHDEAFDLSDRRCDSDFGVLLGLRFVLFCHDLF